jgi:ribose-phosphate pyrophosphokinase
VPASDNYHAARIKVISVAPLFAEAIMRIHKDLSLSALFD